MQKQKRPTLFQNTLTLLAGNGLGAVLSFVITVVLARRLAPTSLGLYVEVLAWLFPAMLIAEFGFGTLLVRDLAAQPHTARALIIRLLPARLLLSTLVISGFVAVMTGKTTPVSGLQLILSAPMIMILPLFTMISAVFRSRQHMAEVAALNVGMLALQTTMLLFAGASLTVEQALAINTFTSLVQLVVAFALLWRLTRHDTGTALVFSMRNWLRLCVPFAAASALGAIQARLFLLLLDAHTVSTELASAALVLRFLDLARLPPMAFFDAMFPRLSAQHDQAPALLRQARQVVVATLLYGSGVTVLLFIFMPAMIILFFGRAYMTSPDIAYAVLLVFLPLTMHAALNLICYATGREWLANGMTLGTMIVLVLAAQITGVTTLTLAVQQAFVEYGACFLLGIMLFVPLYRRAQANARPSATTGRYTPAE